MVDLEKKIIHLFKSSQYQLFEDGMESQFSRELISYIKKYHNDTIKILKDLIIGEKVPSEVASEALRWVGWINDDETYCSRLELLEKALFYSSSNVRDGAILGLNMI